MKNLPHLSRRALLAAGVAATALIGKTRSSFAAREHEGKEDVAGTVKRLKGAALAVRDALPRPLKVGEPVYIGDVLSTGADARLEVSMIDDGLFTLGERTSFVIIDYTFGGDGSPALRLLSGALNAATGAFTAKAGGMTVESEVATIGIRGTKFWIGEIHDIMHVAHWSGGGLVVENKAGRVVLDGPDQGTEIAKATTQPSMPGPWPVDMIHTARSMTDF